MISHRWTSAPRGHKSRSKSAKRRHLIEAKVFLRTHATKMNRVSGSLHPHTVWGAGRVSRDELQDAMTREDAPHPTFILTSPQHR